MRNLYWAEGAKNTKMDNGIAESIHLAELRRTPARHISSTCSTRHTHYHHLSMKPYYLWGTSKRTFEMPMLVRFTGSLHLLGTSTQELVARMVCSALTQHAELVGRPPAAAAVLHRHLDETAARTERRSRTSPLRRPTSCREREMRDIARHQEMEHIRWCD